MQSYGEMRSLFSSSPGSCFCLMSLRFLLHCSVHGEAHLLSPNDEAGHPFLASFIMICTKSCFSSFTYLLNNQVLAYFITSNHRAERNPRILNFSCPPGRSWKHQSLYPTSLFASDFLGFSGLRECTHLTPWLMRNGCMSTRGSPDLF